MSLRIVGRWSDIWCVRDELTDRELFRGRLEPGDELWLTDVPVIDPDLHIARICCFSWARRLPAASARPTS
jgi:hypothetical protein